MWHYGVVEKFVKVCEGLYKEVEMRLVMNGAKSRWFGAERGHRQRCSLSLLFNIYMMGMVEELERAQLGVKLEEHRCGALMYEDDIVLVADSEMKLQTMLEMVQPYAMRWRMKFNSRKSRLWWNELENW